MRLITLYIAFICALALRAAVPEDIRSAIGREYASAVPGEDVAVLMSEIADNGRWPDIDYTDCSRSAWQLERHLDRIVDLSLTFRKGGASDSVLLGAVNRALAHWFDCNYTNPNWWYGKIGVPRRMLAIAYLIDDCLTPSLRRSVDASLDAIDSDDYPARPGGDRIQVLGNHAKVLLWRRDFEGVEKIYDKIEAEARFAPYEEVMYDAGGGLAVRNNMRPSGRGVQADMTFHHRGDRVNSTLTYGLELPEFFSYWATLLRDTDRPFGSESVHFIIDYYLDGVSRHLVGGRFAEPSILNREIARRGAGVFTPDIAERLLAICGGYRAAELRRTVEAIRRGVSDPRSFAVHFHQSDYFVYARPGFRTAVRFYSERTANQEYPHNYEGLRNHFRGDGANMLSATGREYADIAPVFDFRMVPGATTPLVPYAAPEAWGDVVVLNSPVKYAGAVNDSLYGAVAFDFVSSRSDLRARKSWFFFDEGWMCLGSGISASGSDTIVTTVEQCYRAGADANADGWYFNAGNAWHILDGRAVVRREHRTGSWSNCVANAAHAADTVSADVFTLFIDHGAAPRGASYAYAVLPGVSSPAGYGFGIIANTPAVQAVESPGSALAYMVFYDAGTVATHAGTFGAEEPCMMMISGDALYVSDPARRHSMLHVVTPQGRRTVEMPSGAMAGTSVKININANTNL